MPAFYYSPSTTDQRAEIISRSTPVIAGNLAQGAQSLGQTIAGMKQKHDELKAKKALGEAFADQLGVDPKAVDKMKLPQLDAFLTLAPSRIQQKQTQQQSGIMGNALQQWSQAASTPVPASGTDLASAFMGGASGSRMPGLSAPVAMAGRMAQGNPPDIGASFANALASAAASGATPDTISALSNLGKTVSAMYSRGMTTDPSTGLRLFNGRVLPASTQKLLGFGAPQAGQGQDFKFTPGPGGTEFWNFDNRSGEVRPPAPTQRPPNFGLGPFPKGTTFSVTNGVRVATTPDGSMHVLPGGSAAGGPVIDADGNITPTTPAPAASSTTSPKIGDVQDGYKFKGGDASAADNWEKVDE